jgi:hypothetical protein
MKSHLSFVCRAIAGIIMLLRPAFAENAKPDSATTTPAAESPPHQTIGQSSRDIVEQCENEWRAEKEAMMKHNMTEDSYVEQCRVRDDVPALPSETKTKAASSPAPR